MIKIRKINSGFSLVELMVTIVILGILAAVALPSYRKYIVKSKIAESYSIMDEIAKNEISFYNDNGEFYDLPPNPASIDAPMTIATLASWNPFGYPVGQGTSVYFSYQARSGKIDGSSTELANSTTTGYSFSTFSTNTLLLGTHVTPPSTCNTGYTATAFGAVSQANYDWSVVTAVADLDGDGGATCTGIGRLISIAAGSTSNVPNQSAFLSFNAGQ